MVSECMEREQTHDGPMHSLRFRCHVCLSRTFLDRSRDTQTHLFHGLAAHRLPTSILSSKRLLLSYNSKTNSRNTLRGLGMRVSILRRFLTYRRTSASSIIKLHSG